MGEIEIGINAKRERMAKLVSMESAEVKCSIHFWWLALWGLWSGRFVTLFPDSVQFSRNNDCCGVEPITYISFALRLAAHRTYIFQLK